MKRLFYIVVLFYSLQSPIFATAQVRGGVAVHSDPRLAVLLNKTQSIAKAKNPAPAKKNDTRSVAKNDIKKPTDTHIKPVATKADKEQKHTDDNNVKETRRLVSGMSRSGPYSGPGYRVQIYNGSDRNKAARIKAEFMRNYPGVHTYLMYVAPNYRVKVGDFRNREDAMGMYREANSSYTPCMIVPDHISISYN